MPNIEVRNETFYYEKRGKGEALFFVSGMGGDHNDWRWQLPSHARHFTCYTFDCRGAGKSAAAARGQTVDTYTAELLADDLAGIMDALGVEKAHVLGGSMGGVVAQAFALRHPERFLSLSLHSTFARVTGKMRAQFETELYLLGKLEVGEVLMSLAPLIWAERTLTERRYIIEKFRSDRRSAGIAVDRGVYGLQARLALGVDHLSELGRIRGPVLVTTGLDDGLVPPEESRLIHRAIPGSVLRVFPDCGHAVTVENPRGFNTVSLRFLMKQRGRAS